MGESGFPPAGATPHVLLVQSKTCPTLARVGVRGEWSNSTGVYSGDNKRERVHGNEGIHQLKFDSH